jgi:diguanylate cyclase (GGDEF)-like protein/PAS domain S-box-containing protein
MNNNAEFEEIINRSPAVVFLWRNAQGWPVEFVSENVRQFGYAPEDFYSGTVLFSELVHPDDRARVGVEVRAYTEQGRAEFEQEYRILTKAGEVRWLDDRTWVRRNAEGEVTHYQGIVLDITQRREAQLALRDNVVTFRTIIDNMPIMMNAFDGEGRVVVWNRECERVTGYTSKELRGSSDAIELLYPEGAYRERMLEQWDVRQGDFRDWEWDIVTKDGRHRTIAWSNISKHHPIPDWDSWAFGVDVTARKRADETLRSSEQRFRDFADIAGDWFSETDEALRFNYVSGRWQAVTGLAPEQTLGCGLGEVFSDQTDNHGALQELFLKLEAREAFENIELLWTGPDQSRRVLRVSGKPVFQLDGLFQGYRIVGLDVTEGHRISQQLAHQATHDVLTELVNRREFERRLEHALISSREHGMPCTLCYLDLDRFKLVNDTAGHMAGDAMLKQVGQALKHRIRSRDTLARIGGDEFALLLENCSIEKAVEVADGLVGAVQGLSVEWEGRSYNVGASVGLVAICAEAESTAQLLAQADLACYAAKDRGRNRVQVYGVEEEELARRHIAVVHAAGLRDALDYDHFRLYCQPIRPVRKDAGDCLHYEILLRLIDNSGEIVLPAAFIPAAERYGLMGAVDRWVVHNALRSCERLVEQSREGKVCLNLSGNSLNDDSFLGFVQHEFARSSIPPERVCFEIMETAVIHHFPEAIGFITEMKGQGCRFALDDFGRGFSSFTYLKRLPVDFLKIDGNFISNIATDRVDRAMVEALNQVGHIMDIEIIAEWAESDAALLELEALGVDYVQGFAVGAPLPVETVLFSR